MFPEKSSPILRLASVTMLGLIVSTVPNISSGVTFADGDPLNMSGSTITNVATPLETDVKSAATVEYVNNAVTSAFPINETIDLAGYATNSANYGGSCIVPLLDVPSGMRLVIEFVSGTARVLSGATDFISVNVDVGTAVYNDITGQTVGATYYLEPKRIVGSSEDQVLASQHVRLYAQSGNRVRLIWSIPNYKPAATCWAHVSGYLEPLP